MKIKPQSYEDLEVYQLAHRLAVEIHEMSLTELPKFEMYEEGSQIRRSSKSVPANIVEGFGRKLYRNEYVQYLTIALTHVDETKEHLKLLFDTHSLKGEHRFKYFFEQYEILGRKIFNFRKSIRLAT